MDGYYPELEIPNAIMAVILKIPWTKRDKYKYLKCSEKEDDIDETESSSSSTGGEVYREGKGENVSDGPKVTSNQSQSTHENDSKSQMEPLVAPNGVQNAVFLIECLSKAM